MKANNYPRSGGNYMNICGEVSRSLPPELIGRVQLMGGITATALSSMVNMDLDSRVVTVPKDTFLSTIRPNGTRRDLDLLVMSSKENDIEALEEHVKKVVDGRLEVSVFGLRPMSVLDRQRKNPFGLTALKTFLSDRYVNDSGVTKSLFPFAVPIQPDSLDPWTLAVGDDMIPMPSPASTVLNYTNRSISGLRPKDRKKWYAMVAQLRQKYPEIIDQIHEGPASSQLHLTGLVDGLRGGKLDSASAILGARPLIHEDLVRNASHLLGSRRLAIASVALAKAKAGGLGFFESQEGIVKFWQERVEPLVGSIVKNR